MTDSGVKFVFRCKECFVYKDGCAHRKAVNVSDSVSGAFLFSQEDIAVKDEPAVSSCFYIERQHSAALPQKGKIMKRRMDSG